MRIRYALPVLCLAAALPAWPQNQTTQKKVPQPPPSEAVPRSDQDQEQTAPPLGADESSSKQTQIDISPPKDDAKKHPDSDVSDVTEMHPWNPLRAMKDVEVGQFYYKRKNYRAAEDRFREALVYKPGDADATFHLGEALEAEGNLSEAEKNFQDYLKILPDGRYASQAKKSLAKIGEKLNASAK